VRLVAAMRTAISAGSGGSFSNVIAVSVMCGA
jgi:hypothetical protein